MTDLSQIEKLKTLLNINFMECKVQVCMAALVGENGTPTFQVMNLGNGVAGNFKEIAGGHIERQKKDLTKGNLVVHRYDPGAKLDAHEIEYISLSEQEAIANQISALSDVAGLDVFDGNEQFVKALRFYVIVLYPSDGEPALFFRSYSPKMELGRSFLMAVTMQHGHYDTLQNKTFMFDRNVDCISYKGIIYIINKDKFQKIFKFYEELVKVASSVLDTIETCIPIDDFAAFKEACVGHLQKLSKLKNIAAKPYLSDITIGKIKEIIERYQLPITTVGEGEEEKLHFDASDKWGILRVLDDDYLESVMTNNRYEVNSKRQR